MAEKNTSTSEDLIDDGNAVTISKQRNELAITAAAEIEELCNLMRLATKDYDVVEYAIRGLSLRVQDLSTIIMGALCDPDEKTKDLAFRLRRENVEPVEA